MRARKLFVCNVTVSENNQAKYYVCRPANTSHCLSSRSSVPRHGEIIGYVRSFGSLYDVWSIMPNVRQFILNSEGISFHVAGFLWRLSQNKFYWLTIYLLTGVDGCTDWLTAKMCSSCSLVVRSVTLHTHFMPMFFRWTAAISNLFPSFFLVAKWTEMVEILGDKNIYVAR